MMKRLIAGFIRDSNDNILLAHYFHNSTLFKGRWFLPSILIDPLEQRGDIELFADHITAQFGLGFGYEGVALDSRISFLGEKYAIQVFSGYLTGSRFDLEKSEYNGVWWASEFDAATYSHNRDFVKKLLY